MMRGPFRQKLWKSLSNHLVKLTVNGVPRFSAAFQDLTDSAESLPDQQGTPQEKVSMNFTKSKNRNDRYHSRTRELNLMTRKEARRHSFAVIGHVPHL